MTRLPKRLRPSAERRVGDEVNEREHFVSSNLLNSPFRCCARRQGAVESNYPANEHLTSSDCI